MAFLSRISGAFVRLADLVKNGGTVVTTDAGANFGAKIFEFDATGGSLKINKTGSSDRTAIQFRDDNDNVVGSFIFRNTNGTGAGDLDVNGFDKFRIDNRVALQQSFGVSIKPSLALNTYRNPSTERPVLVQLNAVAETDGASFSAVNLQVDESGGTSFDYTVLCAAASNTLGAGAKINASATALIPPGGSYQAVNIADPNGGNSINSVQEWIL